MKPNMRNKHLILKILITITSLIIFCRFIIPMLFADVFTIRGESMNPTLYEGEKVLVNKILFGARIYTDFDFSSPKLQCVRFPGLRKPRIGDVVIFNRPYGRGNQKIEFKINNVYAKRCLGCPGDTIMIENGFYKNTKLQDTFGIVSLQQLLSGMDQNDFDYSIAVFPFSSNYFWTMKEMGPLVIPQRGDIIPINKNNIDIYANIIEYEQGINPRLYIDKDYSVTENYYYFVGDNVLNSQDSRYFGFVPESFIVGIVSKHCL